MAGPLDVFDFGGGVTTTSVIDKGVSVLAADLANSADNTLATVVSFSAEAATTYYVRFVASYDAAATTTGSRWTISCSSAPTAIAYRSRYTLTATTETDNFYLIAHELPAAANASSLAASNLVVIEGMVKTNAACTLAIKNASEVSGSAITAKAGARLEWEKVA
jgi:hypothetical protein